jgi:hypothetical protein
VVGWCMSGVKWCMAGVWVVAGGVMGKDMLVQ